MVALRPSNGATEMGHVHVLEWWAKESGLKLLYGQATLEMARQKAKNGRPDVLEWWANSGLEEKTRNWRAVRKAVDEESSCGQLTELDRLFRTEKYFDYTASAMDSASWHGHVRVLQWWKDSGLPLKYTEDPMDRASWSGHVDALTWWKGSGLELLWTKSALNDARRVEVLEWWRGSGLEMKFDADIVVGEHKPAEAREWWRNSGLLNVDGKERVGDLRGRLMVENDGANVPPFLQGGWMEGDVGMAVDGPFSAWLVDFSSF
ncbi:hypothetical protein HDV00_008835 [Rhizophlyctis rosea]|nr:hypothetical protein HDV00_008835 [Rhizophlyctis rosea]